MQQKYKILSITYDTNHNPVASKSVAEFVAQYGRIVSKTGNLANLHIGDFIGDVVKIYRLPFYKIELSE